MQPYRKITLIKSSHLFPTCSYKDNLFWEHVKLFSTLCHHSHSTLYKLRSALWNGFHMPSLPSYPLTLSTASSQKSWEALPVWLAEYRPGQEASCERGVAGGLAERTNRSLAKDAFAARFRSDVWWPKGCFPHRAEKQFMKNDMMARGDYLGGPSKLTHRVYTLPWPEDLNIISTDRWLWSSMCTCNWPLKGFLEQTLWYWKLCTHKSCRPHPTVNHRFGHVIHWLIVLCLQSPCSPWGPTSRKTRVHF